MGFFLLFGILAITFVLGFVMGIVYKEEKKEIKVCQNNINDFATLVSKIEGKNRSVDIAQIKEILRIINDLLNGKFYELIRNTEIKKNV